MALLSVELRRAAARRLVRVLVVLALAGAFLMSVLFFVNTEKAPASTAGDPAVTATTSVPVPVVPGAGTPATIGDQSCTTTGGTTTCSSPSGSSFATGTANKEFRLTDLYLSKAEQQHRGLERFGNKPKNVLMSPTVLFILMALIAGASFIGAEYKAGTIGTLLTWESRRLRVLAAKLAAAAIAAALVYLAFQVVFSLMLWPVAVMHGTTAGADSAFFSGLALFLLRGAAVVGLAAIIGGCIATLGRNTAAALGGLLAYLIAVEAVLLNLKPAWRPWSLVENLSALIDGASVEINQQVRSPGAALVIIGGYVAALVLATGAVFFRRDIA